MSVAIKLLWYKMIALTNAYFQRGKMKPLCYGFISIALSEVRYLNVGVSPKYVLIRGLYQFIFRVIL